MSRFQTRTALAIGLAVISIALLIFGTTPALEPFRNSVLWPLATLQQNVAGLWRGLVAPFIPTPSDATLRERNAQLETENEQLRAEVVRLRENENQLRILTGLIDFAESQPENDYLVANLIGRDPSPLLTYLIFDRGSDDGIQRGMPVVTGAGLVGRVVEVTNRLCKVQPITDPASAVAARLQTSRQTGVVVGQVGGGLAMEFITQRVELQPGEIVLTSGLGGVFPPGIVIGAVSAVQQLNYEVQQRADLTPAADFNRIEAVLIIINFKPADFSPFFQATPTPVAPVAP